MPLLLHLLLLLSIPTTSLSIPMNCSDPTRLCTSFFSYPAHPNLSLPHLQSLFDVLPHDITVDVPSDPSFLFIRKNCSCSPRLNHYLTNTTLTVPDSSSAGTTVSEAAAAAYGGLEFPPPGGPRPAQPGKVVSLRLMCGCSSGLWNYLMSYVAAEGDSIGSMGSRFGVSMDSIEAVNGVADPDNVTAGRVYYIPLDSVPGVPYPVKDILETPAAAPALAPTTFYTISVDQRRHSSTFPYGWILGSMGAALFLAVVALLMYVLFKRSVCCSKILGNHAKDPDGRTSHKFHIFRRATFCNVSGSYLCCRSGKWKPTSDTNSHKISIPTGVPADAFDMEKPIVFSYEEILSSTEGFSDSNLLGHGTYGSVYFAVLRDQEVAIKRMTATKTKEFMAEIKVLCKVHHASLVELIGYAASEDELFLIYEYAQKGSLKSHLHESQNKGHTSLSWIARVQIALDTARGLEYIHEHTKPHYVHRDIKTSNILLDSAYRAKISDFGLAKLVVATGEGEATATRVVGTFGYLAPEYLRDGLATTKSDVYAFGVVLFELITAREAITRTEAMAVTNTERRSLASIMLATLKNCPSSMSMESLKDCIDPNLMDLYPHDCVYKMAMLAKQCVDEDPVLRPDIKHAVITLSQILLSSVEWEATLAGNSQVFSGLVQGR
ncbi:LysM domain receptor-like kinase 3 [Acorus calamus]|uniref:LysM domain receptor-like kinase 3 n=1 Tax=Acorus calamus TaxID=4465 RepID=A0AAV9ELW9_ACOCL|nr:LysM domain receptor-like kinase 3 [Acorus calamus]